MAKRWLLAILLFIMAWLIVEGKTVWSHQGKIWLYKTVAHSAQFPQVQSWYQSYFAQIPFFLPAYTPTPALPVDEYRLPSQQVMKRTSYTTGQGIWIETHHDDHVVAVATGWVRFAGQLEGLGNTVILQLPAAQQVWYVGLGQLKVRENDWVVKGSEIAEVYTTSAQVGRYYFAWKKDGQFIDPEDVIPFDAP